MYQVRELLSQQLGGGSILLYFRFVLQSFCLGFDLDGQILLQLYDVLTCKVRIGNAAILRSPRGFQPRVEMIEETLSVLVYLFETHLAALRWTASSWIMFFV